MEQMGQELVLAGPETGSEDSAGGCIPGDWNPEQILEALGESLVFLDLRDLPVLAELHTAFESLEARAMASEVHPDLARVAALAGALISEIILEEHPDPKQGLETLGAMVDQMRQGLRTGKPVVMSEGWFVAEADVDPDTAPSAGLGESDADSDMGMAPGEGFGGDPELLREFFQEAREHLEQAEVNLLTLEAEPENQEAISAVFRAFHTVKGGAGLLQRCRIQYLSHVAETLLDKVRQGSIRMEGEVIDLCLEASDGLKRLVDAEDGGGTADAAPDGWLQDLTNRIDAVSRQVSPPQKLGDIMVRRGATSRNAVEAALEKQQVLEPKPKLGALLVASGDARAQDTVDAIRAQNEQRRPAAAQRESIKVDADRLDLLVDLIGELVIAESMVRQSEELLEDPMSPICRRLSQMDKITRELQTISMSLRMVPVRATFQKMARLVRDLAKKFGKEVEFVTEGDDTELDKNVVDLVADPLMHMVRNAIDHGVESPDERELMGKPRKSQVVLRAYHEGGGIYIDIVDDGRGLDREAILSKAIERGLVQPGEPLSDSEVWKLIFHPGLSTAKKVTDVSGRGVGMDVVQRNIYALHGSIDVKSKEGSGSTFSIRLPLTLAIIDGMAVRAGEERFIVPIGNVVRATRPQPGEVHTVRGQGEVLHQHNRLIPLFRLHRIMDIPNAVENSEEGIVLILEDNGKQIGLLADDLLGQQQVVIKPLGKGVGAVQGLAGGAIMPDGRVGLILDTAGLFQRARSQADDAADARELALQGV
jgi:two-component system chemotaxis sensor kinase CheA